MRYNSLSVNYHDVLWRWLQHDPHNAFKIIMSDISFVLSWMFRVFPLLIFFLLDCYELKTFIS
jgi:hypothetical protein